MDDFQIDRELAEKLMGWTWSVGSEVSCWKTKEGRLIGGFNPTHDPSAMMQVLNKLLERGFKCHIYCDPDAPDIDLPDDARFSITWPVKNHTQATTMQRAICLAAIQFLSANAVPQ